MRTNSVQSNVLTSLQFRHIPRFFFWLNALGATVLVHLVHAVLLNFYLIEMERSWIKLVVHCRHKMVREVHCRNHRIVLSCEVHKERDVKFK